MIGESGPDDRAARQSGYTMTERSPDYVVLGETRTYSFERITRAIRLVAHGSRFIATNPDATGPTPDGPLPATGSVAALMSRATGVDPYFVGKPNPLMMRSALNRARRALRVGRDGGRPDGHGRDLWARGRPPGDPGAHGSHPRAPTRSDFRSARRGSSTRSRTSSTSSSTHRKTAPSPDRTRP